MCTTVLPCLTSSNGCHLPSQTNISSTMKCSQNFKTSIINCILHVNWPSSVLPSQPRFYAWGLARKLPIDSQVCLQYQLVSLIFSFSCEDVMLHSKDCCFIVTSHLCWGLSKLGLQYSTGQTELDNWMAFYAAVVVLCADGNAPRYSELFTTAKRWTFKQSAPLVVGWAWEDWSEAKSCVVLSWYAAVAPPWDSFLKLYMAFSLWSP